MIKIIVVILFFFSLFACNPVQKASQNKSVPLAVPFTCLASQSRCDISTDLGTFTVEFSGLFEEGKIKTELPFTIQLTFETLVENAQLRTINSYLEGKSMFMGKIPVFFQLAENNSKIMTAETMLVNCSEEIMTWRLWFAVEIEQAGKTTVQDFFVDFDSKRL
jgi:hypothetical protein